MRRFSQKICLACCVALGIADTNAMSALSGPSCEPLPVCWDCSQEVDNEWHEIVRSGRFFSADPEWPRALEQICLKHG